MEWYFWLPESTARVVQKQWSRWRIDVCLANRYFYNANIKDKTQTPLLSSQGFFVYKARLVTWLCTLEVKIQMYPYITSNKALTLRVFTIICSIILKVNTHLVLSQFKNVLIEKTIKPSSSRQNVFFSWVKKDEELSVPILYRVLGNNKFPISFNFIYNKLKMYKR
jgi:hypothetical protein